MAIWAVHPRRRGEHTIPGAIRASLDGSSPQARGTPLGTSSEAGNVRFIPAGAGNTGSGSSGAGGSTVHPRRRGEHTSSAQTCAVPSGSSPQARGTRATSFPVDALYRFIPAGAGNTPGDRPACSPGTVHPRRRGEHADLHRANLRGAGSSPQARGTQLRGADLSEEYRFIPAGAGNTPYFPENEMREFGSSPQARGTPGTPAAPARRIRFIPAGAGNTLRRSGG